MDTYRMIFYNTVYEDGEGKGRITGGWRDTVLEYIREKVNVTRQPPATIMKKTRREEWEQGGENNALKKLEVVRVAVIHGGRQRREWVGA